MHLFERGKHPISRAIDCESYDENMEYNLVSIEVKRSFMGLFAVRP